jgi:alpha-L-fucosidase
VISIDDVSVLLSHVLGNISLTGQTLLNADVNGDGVISIDDVSMLLFLSMNK